MPCLTKVPKLKNFTANENQMKKKILEGPFSYLLVEMHLISSKLMPKTLINFILTEKYLSTF